MDTQGCRYFHLFPSPLLTDGDDELSPDAGAGDPVTAAAGAGGAARGAIRWDEILPRCSLRVLLVEHDDSTRWSSPRSSASVTPVAGGMKAWEVMRGYAYAFDLVLREVNMPMLYGIDLLSRIVAADECKNIPVLSMTAGVPEADQVLH